jgi:hypothetical protein
MPRRRPTLPAQVSPKARAAVARPRPAKAARASPKAAVAKERPMKGYSRPKR